MDHLKFITDGYEPTVTEAGNRST